MEYDILIRYEPQVDGHSFYVVFAFEWVMANYI